jgi:hypothetical protein
LQILSLGLNLVAPTNMASYAVFAPAELLELLQLWLLHFFKSYQTLSQKTASPRNYKGEKPFFYYEGEAKKKYNI